LIRLKFKTLLISALLFCSFSAHAELEDFVCPDGFMCPEELMVEVDYWAKRYGELDDTQMMIYDYRYRNIYSIYQCKGNCDYDSNKTIHRDRIKNLVASVQEKVEKKNFNFTEEELPIYESIQSVKNFKWRDKKSQAKNLPASAFVVYEFGKKQNFLEGSKFYNEHRDFIANQLQLNGLPAALEFLPFAESEYDPFIESDADCVGTWQLSQDAAQKNGLIVNTVIDERRDPIKSTVAAMGYYTTSEKEFMEIGCQIDFDFPACDIGPLLMLGYIYGREGTKRAMKQLQTTNYMQIHNNHKGATFGRDTKSYLSKFLGLYHVGMNQEKYFGELPRIEKKDTQVLLLSKSTSLSKTTKPEPITTTFDLNVNELKYLPANMRYTDSVWDGSRSIPPNNQFEIPYVDTDEVKNYGKVISINRTVPREKIEFIKPRPLQPILLQRAEPKLASPIRLPVPAQKKSGKWKRSRR
jgi:hypothetical protein